VPAQRAYLEAVESGESAGPGEGELTDRGAKTSPTGPWKIIKAAPMTSSNDTTEQYLSTLLITRLVFILMNGLRVELKANRPFGGRDHAASPDGGFVSPDSGGMGLAGVASEAAALLVPAIRAE
jgi:hypothetical protein